jgi:hypothetical protein
VCLVEIPSLNAVEIHTAGHRMPERILSVPPDGIVSRGLLGIHQANDFLPEYVIDDQRNLARLWKRIFERGFGVEGVGEIVVEGILTGQKCKAISQVNGNIGIESAVLSGDLSPTAGSAGLLKCPAPQREFRS